jgi:uncharacterized membrane protein
MKNVAGWLGRAFSGFVLAFMVALPRIAWAAGGKPATKLVNVADTRHMEVGFSRWIADLYNYNLWLFALATVVIMAFLGLVLGYSFDKLVGLLGLNLGKLDHHE